MATTKEYKLINKFYKQGNTEPSNLIIRVSAPMKDQVLTGHKHTSSVMEKVKLSGTVCNAYKQDNECKDCRLCWDKDIKNITYKYH